MTPIDLTRLQAPQVADYCATADRRIVSGFRLALETLGIPVPDYAARLPSGRQPLSALMAAVDKDSGSVRNYRDEKRGVGAFAPMRGTA